ncbi:hypothetical protein [Pontibacter rugosus]
MKKNVMLLLTPLLPLCLLLVFQPQFLKKPVVVVHAPPIHVPDSLSTESAPASSSSIRKDMVAYAKSFLGTPTYMLV